MRQLIATINMSLDGYCDHTAMSADEEVHDHFTEVIRNAGAILYGRKTYQLMESYWPTLVKSPTGEKSMDDFARAIDDIPKIVFSRTLEHLDWKNSVLKKELTKEYIAQLKEQPGKDILVGSPSLIVATTQFRIVDSYQLLIHPTIVGTGLQLFKNISERVDLKLLKSKTFGNGVTMLYYQTVKK